MINHKIIKFKKFNELYNKIILESINQNKIIQVSREEMKEIIENNSIDNQNPRIKNFDQIIKLVYYDPSDVNHFILKDENDQIRAYAGCRKNVHNSYYINEFLSFKHGYGSILLHYLLNFNYDIIYLNSNWEAGESLNRYYRKPEFNLTETTYQRETGPLVHYFYLNKNLNDKELQEFIKNNMK